MGGYQALQKVLGASSLERKCRLLFGASLFLLICGSFWWYSKTAEEMVHEKNRRTGQHLVDAAMLKTHFVKWHLGDKSDSLPSAKEPLLQDVIPVLENLEYDYQFLATERPFNDSMVELPGDADEEAILRQLKKELWALYRTEREKLEEKPPSEDTVAAVEGESAEYDPEEDLVKRVKPVFATRRFVGIGGRTEYRYYQAVFWYTQCISCHRPLGTGFENYEDHFDFDGTGVTDDVRQVPVFDESLPVHVVRVIIPDDPTQRAINRSRSVLIAAGIVTVFLAMLALYIIVRYVIVKPLRHLRDVSDEVGRGNYELRADLQTNDEFEDVARSFNRMVRHLVEAQDQLRTANSELDTKLDQLAQLNMQLYEMNQLKSGFLANMSHELRTPLNSIIGFADVLRGLDTLTDKQKRYASNIARSGRVLLDMINDILDLAKVESGKMKVRPSEFQIDVLARGQCDTVRPLSEDKNIDLEVHAPVDLPEMYQDQAKVQQILMNLLSNAIKFTPEGGRINVTLARDVESPDDPESGMLVMMVEDTGVGIAEEDFDVIFEKFRQAKATVGEDQLTRQYSGTGLGLSIVKELCKLLGGEISFESQLGRGSKFLVRLPWVLPASLTTHESDRGDDLNIAESMLLSGPPSGSGELKE